MQYICDKCISCVHMISDKRGIKKKKIAKWEGGNLKSFTLLKFFT